VRFSVRKLTAPLIAVALLGCVAYFGFAGRMPRDTEHVLTPGMVITAHTPQDTIIITGDRGTKRTFEGNGWRKTRNLTPRDSRWDGSYGLYDPADSFTMGGRLLVEEGRLFFNSESEALRFLNYGHGDTQYVFTNRGLVVGFEVEPVSGQEPVRWVEIWQIYINGHRPKSMLGADDSAISQKGGTIPDRATPYPAPVGQPMELSDKEYIPLKAK
jgi:hypothetical protein